MSLNFLGIAGSLRRKSTNQGLLRAASTRLPAGVEMDLADLTDIPFYNADITDKPASVVRVLEQIGRADALVLVTEWKEFRNPDFDAIKAALKQPVIFDGRNLYEPAFMKSLGIEYRAIGRGLN